MLEVYTDMLPFFKKFAHWCKQPYQWDIEIEIEFNNIAERKYGFEITGGFLLKIYYLISSLDDRIKHGDELLHDTYLTKTGIEDLDFIIECIENKNVAGFEDDLMLIKRLNKLSR